MLLSWYILKQDVFCLLYTFYILQSMTSLKHFLRYCRYMYIFVFTVIFLHDLSQCWLKFFIYFVIVMTILTYTISTPFFNSWRYRKLTINLVWYIVFFIVNNSFTYLYSVSWNMYTFYGLSKKFNIPKLEHLV